MKEKAKNKKWQIVVAVLLGLLITLIGGAKLMTFFVIAVGFFFVGKKYGDLMRLYQEWKLAVKVNTVQYSAKQMEAMQTEIKTLKDEISSANQRLQVYQMTSAKAVE